MQASDLDIRLPYGVHDLTKGLLPRSSLGIPGGLHTSSYVGGENFDLAASEAIAWFKRYL
jgi:hypothetical protein